jgi:hypothetical protein
VGKDLEVHSHDLFQDAVLAFVYTQQENLEQNVCPDGQQPDQHSNWVPLRHEH